MSINGNSNVFVIMPFKEDYLKFFEFLKSKLDNIVNLTNANTNNMINIMSDVINGINDADFIIADITEINANVYYELGIAHALNKKVIMITQKTKNLPFDINTYRVLTYSTQAWEIENILKDLVDIIKGSNKLEFRNPVIDNIEKKNNHITIYNSNPVIANNVEMKNEEPYGFLDNIIEIEQGVKEITKSVLYITDKMKYMTNQIVEISDNINRINNNQPNAFLIKKQAQKAAEEIKSFSDEFQTFNMLYDISSTRLFNNYNDLLENNSVNFNANESGFSTLLMHFIDLKTAMDNTKNMFVNFDRSSQNLVGIEQSLTFSAKSLSKNNSDFIFLLDKSIESIERIEIKQNYIFTSLNKN